MMTPFSKKRQYQKISRRCSRSPKYAETGHFRHILKDLERTCKAFVLRTKQFVWWPLNGGERIFPTSKWDLNQTTLKVSCPNVVPICCDLPGVRSPPTARVWERDCVCGRWLCFIFRFGIGRFTTEEEIDYTVERTIKHVKRLREMRLVKNMMNL